MPERTSYEPGTPSWVDLASPDPDNSAAFYADLLGWEAGEPGPVDETGGYRTFTLRGRNVAGLGPVQGDSPPSWTTYITVEDADATAVAVSEAGGQVAMEPADVLDAGRMAVFADPTGAFFGVWQPGTTIGAQLVNEPGAMCWNELATRDFEAAKRFYARVFGWTAADYPDENVTYAIWNAGERGVGGLLAMDDTWPGHVPSHWDVCFAVAECDATVDRCTALGGSVAAPPTDSPFGRYAALNDPDGAAFAVIALTAPAD